MTRFGISGRRTKKLTFQTSASRFVISLRTFRTDKTKRTRRNSQLTFAVRGLPIKEVSIVKTKRRRSSKQGVRWRFMALASAARLRPRTSLLLIAGVIGASYFGSHLKTSPDIVLAAKSSTSHMATPTPKHLVHSVPTQLRIPSINLSAPLAAVGLKTDGSLDVPSDPTMAGWYQNSPTPGEIGPSIIDGHVDRVGGIAIFWRLRELQPGDQIQINRADGTTVTFKVTDLQQFPQDNFPTKQIYGNLDYAGLRLITCGGVFNTETHHYSDNIVIFGTLVN
jgi:sortase (surface protein transpeptidase)